MNDSEVLGVLIYANELDARHSPNEAKVYAWQDVLREGAPELTLAFARDCIRKHYATMDDMVSPAMLVQAWRRHSRVTSEARLSEQKADLDAHCGRAHCLCPHTNHCYKGWIDSAHETSPCRHCRATLAHTLGKIGPPGTRSDHDWSVLRHRERESAQ